MNKKIISVLFLLAYIVSAEQLNKLELVSLSNFVSVFVKEEILTRNQDVVINKRVFCYLNFFLCF